MTTEKENGVFLTVPEIAQAWGVSIKTVRRWELTPVDKRGNADLFLLSDVVENRRQAPGDIQAERARKEKELADKYEIENQISRGELVRANDVADKWVVFVENSKNKLLGIKTRVSRILAMNCSAQIDSLEIKRIENAIDGEIKTALSELARNRVDTI